MGVTVHDWKNSPEKVKDCYSIDYGHKLHQGKQLESVGDEHEKKP